MKAAVDHKGNAVHQPHFFERDQRQHVGDHDASQADEAIQNGAPDHANGGLRLLTAGGIDQTLCALPVDPAADLEHHE